MDRNHIFAGPPLQRAGESCARGDGAVGCAYGPAGECGFHFSVEPQSIFAPLAQVAQEVGRNVECVPTEKNLRHGRAVECKISGRQKHVGTGAPYQARQAALLVPKPSPRTRGPIFPEKSYTSGFRDLSTEGSTDQQGGVHVIPNRQTRYHVAHVSKPSSRSGRDGVYKKVDHFSLRIILSAVSHN